MTIKIGQRYQEKGNEEISILAEVGYKQVCLIGLNSGNRFVDPIGVENPDDIQEDDFIKITNGLIFNGVE